MEWSHLDLLLCIIGKWCVRVIRHPSIKYSAIFQRWLTFASPSSCISTLSAHDFTPVAIPINNLKCLVICLLIKIIPTLSKNSLILGIQQKLSLELSKLNCCPGCLSSSIVTHMVSLAVCCTHKAHLKWWWNSAEKRNWILTIAHDVFTDKWENKKLWITWFSPICV